mmetsp:Transcript_20139/g.36536  ORF Transcript_20139/g.36536 Transcript_20139/m.36536 type:complete len:241 (+) Transcript_20139:281-1003(+)
MSFSITSTLASDFIASSPSFFTTLLANSAGFPSVLKYSGASNRNFNSSTFAVIISATIMTRNFAARGASTAISLRNSRGSFRPIAIDLGSIFLSLMHLERTVRKFFTSTSFISITIKVPTCIILAPRSTDPSSPAQMSSANDKTASSVSPPTKYSLRMPFALFPHSAVGRSAPSSCLCLFLCHLLIDLGNRFCLFFLTSRHPSFITHFNQILHQKLHSVAEWTFLSSHVFGRCPASSEWT